MIHGLRSTYQRHGCHCSACTTANRVYQGQYRHAYRSGRPPLGAHVPAEEAFALLAVLEQDGFTKATIARRVGHQWPILHYDLHGVTLRTTLRLRWLVRQVAG